MIRAREDTSSQISSGYTAGSIRTARPTRIRHHYQIHLGCVVRGSAPQLPRKFRRSSMRQIKFRKKTLSHAQIQCNQFVNQSIDAAFPNAVPDLNTTDPRNGYGPFDAVATPSVGDLMLLAKPGHVVFVTQVSNSAVNQFLGSQSSSGPAYVDLPNHYWSQQMICRIM